MKNALINLLKVKTILSLLFSVTTCYLAVAGKINMETFVAFTMAIITYYFNKKENEK
jgi:hypothetical protein